MQPVGRREEDVKQGGDVQVRRAVEKWKETNDLRDMDKVSAPDPCANDIEQFALQTLG
jgi:hypothetical protein